MNKWTPVPGYRLISSPSSMPRHHVWSNNDTNEKYILAMIPMTIMLLKLRTWLFHSYNDSHDNYIPTQDIQQGYNCDKILLTLGNWRCFLWIWSSTVIEDVMSQRSQRELCTWWLFYVTLLLLNNKRRSFSIVTYYTTHGRRLSVSHKLMRIIF